MKSHISEETGGNMRNKLEMLAVQMRKMGTVKTLKLRYLTGMVNRDG
jgi:hypothetical protein